MAYKQGNSKGIIVNDGKIIKNFIVCGINVEQALANISNTWQYGFFNAIYVPCKIDDISQSDIECLKRPEDLNLIFVDNDLYAMKRMINYISHLQANHENVDILSIVIVDSTEQELNDELACLHLEIKAMTSTSYTHTNHCKSKAIESLIATYNHLYCGFAISCIEFMDFNSVIKAGYYFESTEMTVTRASELPFAVYKAFDNICGTVGKAAVLKGVSLIIISNDDFSVPLFSACSTMIEGCFKDDINFICNSNLQSNNEHSIHLSLVFDKSDDEVILSKNELLDIPMFIKNKLS